MIYITYEDSVVTSLGIWKKMQAQYRVFKKAFGNAYYTLYRGQMMHLFKDGEMIEKTLAITKKECNEALINWMMKYKLNRSYIRYDFADKYFLDFLQKQEKLGIKSVLEFPTVPYDGLFSKQVVAEDYYYREQLYKYVKCCTTFSDVEKVFNIPCITLVNGVDINEQKEKQYRKRDGSIILLAVATLGKWHGYERIIQGMHEYYLNGGKRNIAFYLVGEGSQLSYYHRLTDEYQLQEHVIFCGKLEGKNLDEVYDNSDIAIGSLGMYKTGVKSAAPIKLREYCARGIPFIYGYDDISFDDQVYFGHRVSDDATPIDIEEVINFYERLYDGRDFIKDMRKFTLEHLTWDRILKPVVEYLDSDEERK